MRVTRLRADPRAPACLVVEVDGARFASIPAEDVSALGLRRGVDLDAATVERLRHAADLAASHRVALRLLAARPRSVQELLRRLRDRGHNPSAAAHVVGRLEEAGVLNDAEFARHFVRVHSGRGQGPGRLLRDLVARGVERRVAERAIDEVLDAEGIDPVEQARALAHKRARQLGTLPRQTLRRRLLAYLSRRGFRRGEVIDLVNEVLSREDCEVKSEE